MLYRVVVKESRNANAIIYENIIDSEMLSHYEKYKESFLLNIYHKEKDSMWKLESVFKNGKMVQYMGIHKEDADKKSRDYGTDFSMSDLFEKIKRAAPTRKENTMTLLKDIICGEDISKPKLKCIDTRFIK